MIGRKLSVLAEKEGKKPKILWDLKKRCSFFCFWWKRDFLNPADRVFSPREVALRYQTPTYITHRTFSSSKKFSFWIWTNIIYNFDKYLLVWWTSTRRWHASRNISSSYKLPFYFGLDSVGVVSLFGNMIVMRNTHEHQRAPDDDITTYTSSS